MRSLSFAATLHGRMQGYEKYWGGGGEEKTGEEMKNRRGIKKGKRRKITRFIGGIGGQRMR